MAKKRRKQEEKKEEREYKPPEFDKLDYVKTEVSVSKATILAALFSIPMGLVAMFVVPVGGVWGGLMAGLGGMAILWYILPSTKIDTKSFKWTHWAGALSTYFLVFLMVWVIVCNPPFNDFAHPEIRNVQVSWDGSITWVNVTETDLGGSMVVQWPGNVTNMTVRAQVTDNVDVDVSTVMITRDSNEPVLMSESNNQYFEYTFTNVGQVGLFKITAVDVNGNINEGYSFTLTL